MWEFSEYDQAGFGPDTDPPEQDDYLDDEGIEIIADTFDKDFDEIGFDPEEDDDSDDDLAEHYGLR